MTKKIYIIVLLSLVIFIVSVLSSGCGSSSPTTTSSNGIGSGVPYGTIILSGSGSAVTGTSFKPISKRVGVSRSTGSFPIWYNINTSTGFTYPYDTIAVLQNIAGGITSVQFVHYSTASVSDQWVVLNPAVSAASMTATAVTFNNLLLLGAASTTSSLTLNGTLSY